jgi:hypothetical protein
MRKWATFLPAVLVFFATHEGFHMLTAAIVGEYEAFHVRPTGLEVALNKFELS